MMDFLKYHTKPLSRFAGEVRERGVGAPEGCVDKRRTGAIAEPYPLSNSLPQSGREGIGAVYA